jgi:hypothetical protein
MDYVYDDSENKKEKKDLNVSEQKFKIVYPSIYEGLCYIEDEEWLEIMTDLVYGKTPSGFSIRNFGITYNLDKKKTFIQPNSIDPETAVNEVIDFFKNIGNIKTTKDQSRIKQKGVEQYADRNGTWNKMKMNTKKYMIGQYVKEQKKLNNLSSDEETNLRTLLILALENGVLNNNNIKYNKKIISVDIIKYSKNKYSYAPCVYEKTNNNKTYVNKIEKTPLYRKKFKSFSLAEKKLKESMEKDMIKQKTNGYKVSKNCSASHSSLTPSLDYGKNNENIKKAIEPVIYSYNENNIMLSPRKMSRCDEIFFKYKK